MVGNPSAAERDITLESLSGDVILIVPADFSMDVEIKLAYNKQVNKEFQIFSDFNISERKNKEWSYSDGMRKKYIYGKGEINGGKNKIILKTVNGNIYLKKS
jgi:hypothetical protein